MALNEQWEELHTGAIWEALHGPTLLRQHLVPVTEGRQPLASHLQFEESQPVCGDIALVIHSQEIVEEFVAFVERELEITGRPIADNSVNTVEISVGPLLA